MPSTSKPDLTRSTISVLLATAGGVGYLPWAPGAWGSLIGVLLGFLVTRTLAWPMAILVIVLGGIACAFICTSAEQALQQHDPSMIVLDEVYGMCVVFVVCPWIASSLLWLIAAFLLFRLFDIIKPFPLRRLERLPTGWGIMADDIGAALYAAVLVWMVHGWRH